MTPIAELYAQNNPVARGSTELGPEGINTIESGLNVDYLVHDNLFVSLSLFDFDAKALIDYVFDVDLNSNVAQNIGRQTGRGGELNIRWKPRPDTNINFYNAKIKTENGDGTDIADVPNDQFYLDLNWRFTANFNWYINSKWIKNRKRAINDSRNNIADYQLVNTRLSYSNYIPGLTTAIVIKNLFNSNAREPSNGAVINDYPQPGRQWLLELSYLF